MKMSGGNRLAISLDPPDIVAIAEGQLLFD